MHIWILFRQKCKFLISHCCSTYNVMPLKSTHNPLCYSFLAAVRRKQKRRGGHIFSLHFHRNVIEWVFISKMEKSQLWARETDHCRGF